MSTKLYILYCSDRVDKGISDIVGVFSTLKKAKVIARTQRVMDDYGAIYHIDYRGEDCRGEFRIKKYHIDVAE